MNISLTKHLNWIFDQIIIIDNVNKINKIKLYNNLKI